MTALLEKTLTLTGYELASLLALTLSMGIVMGASAGILILAFLANSRSNNE